MRLPRIAFSPGVQLVKLWQRVVFYACQVRILSTNSYTSAYIGRSLTPIAIVNVDNRTHEPVTPHSQYRQPALFRPMRCFCASIRCGHPSAGKEEEGFVTSFTTVLPSSTHLSVLLMYTIPTLRGSPPMSNELLHTSVTLNATIPFQPGSSSSNSAAAESLILGVLGAVFACASVISAYLQLRQGSLSRYAASVLFPRAPGSGTDAMDELNDDRMDRGKSTVFETDRALAYLLQLVWKYRKSWRYFFARYRFRRRHFLHGCWVQRWGSGVRSWMTQKRGDLEDMHLDHALHCDAMKQSN